MEETTYSALNFSSSNFGANSPHGSYGDFAGRGGKAEASLEDGVRDYLIMEKYLT